MATLFAVYHGDSISDFTNSIREVSNSLNILYMFIYTCLFAMAVYNFFTSVIGDSWIKVKFIIILIIDFRQSKKEKRIKLLKNNNKFNWKHKI